VLAGAGVAVQVACCAGVVLMRDALCRLHYTAPAALAAGLVAAALLVRVGVTQLSGRAILIAGLLAIGSPIQAHATARAIRLRRVRRAAAPEQP
jgi:multisubunit Na+/H+ antiporter MnhG subunit